MPNATQDNVGVIDRAGDLTAFPVAANANIFSHSIVGGVGANTDARPWVATDKPLGISNQAVNNVGGAAGARTVEVQRGVFRIPHDGSINRSHILTSFARPLDDSTVRIEAVATTPTADTLGLIVDVEGTLAWVDTRIRR